AFLRHCTPRSSERGLAATAVLTRDAFRYFDEMIADGLELDLQRRGLLLIGTSQASIDEEFAELSKLSAHEIPVEISRLTAAECREREPVIGPAVAGGIYVSTEGHLDPRELTKALAATITARGGRIRTGEAVTGFVTEDQRVSAVVAGGEIPASNVVIAAGAHSVPVTRMLGVRLPMTAGKGYSFSVTSTRELSSPMYLLETKAGVSPMAGRVRFAGTIEFSGLNTYRDPRRIDALKLAARGYFPDFDWTTSAEEWTGMRPLCPDGLPVMDRVPGFENAYVATGHSTLGITLAAVTGAHMATFVGKGTAPAELQPFRFPSYFGRR
ncbi:MAG: FAD-binding oxidoreductase, partial [Nocardiopsaceae bacterium]|nr:FAD-binding oxidoreductase [Nocardiopsaceae bacterium]